MRTLLVDARWFNGSGLGRYLGEVLGEVLRDGRFDRFRMLGAPDAILAFAEEHRALERVEALAYPTAPYSPLAQAAWLALRSRGVLRCDAAFFPHYDAPFFGMPRRSVVAVHDLIHFEVPDAFPLRRRLAAGVVLDRVVKSAAHILVLSGSTHRDLVRRVPSAEGKTTIAPVGIGALFRDLAGRQPPRSAASDALRPYLLCVGNRKPHKNLVAAVEVLARLKTEHPELKLVVAGGSGDGWAPVMSRAGELGVSDAIVDVRGPTDAELAALYSSAELLLFPSLYEGLGLPVLEAMACGTPVVASNRSSIPEIAGDAALLVDPQDHAGMAEAVRSVLMDAGRRADLVVRGRRRFAAFDWHASVLRAVSVLDQVASAGRATPLGAAPAVESGERLWQEG
jgi:glycosyltransferase involved in cell wall biosynthesis